MNTFYTGLTRSLSFGPSRANWILAKIFATRGIVAKAASIHPLWEQHQQRLIELPKFTPMNTSYSYWKTLMKSCLTVHQLAQMN
jgi:hypothetical protein